jgi:hypothetical protein
MRFARKRVGKDGKIWYTATYVDVRLDPVRRDRRKAQPTEPDARAFTYLTRSGHSRQHTAGSRSGRSPHSSWRPGEPHAASRRTAISPVILGSPARRRANPIKRCRASSPLQQCREPAMQGTSDPAGRSAALDQSRRGMRLPGSARPATSAGGQRRPPGNIWPATSAGGRRRPPGNIRPATSAGGQRRRSGNTRHAASACWTRPTVPAGGGSISSANGGAEAGWPMCPFACGSVSCAGPGSAFRGAVWAAQAAVPSYRR